MNNEERAVNILRQLEYSTRVDPDNYNEVKKAIIQVLNLASERKYIEAEKQTQAAFTDGLLREKVLQEIVTLQGVDEKTETLQLKYCPLCDQSYSDPSYIYCLNDRTPLISSSNFGQANTLILNDDKGSLEIAAEIEDAFQETTNTALQFAIAQVDFSNKLEAHNLRLDKINASTASGKSKRKLQAFSEVALDIRNYAQQIENLLPNFNKSVDVIETNFPQYVNSIDTASEKDKSEAKKACEKFAEYTGHIKRALMGWRAFRAALSDLEGLSSDLTRACRLAEKVLDKVISKVNRFEVNVTYSLELLKNRIS